MDLLSCMDPYERTHLCDGLKEKKVKAGEIIITNVNKIKIKLFLREKKVIYFILLIKVNFKQLKF